MLFFGCPNCYLSCRHGINFHSFSSAPLDTVPGMCDESWTESNRCFAFVQKLPPPLLLPQTNLWTCPAFLCCQSWSEMMYWPGSLTCYLSKSFSIATFLLAASTSQTCFISTCNCYQQNLYSSWWLVLLVALWYLAFTSLLFCNYAP